MKNWLKNLKIKGKLNLMIGVTIACILLFGIVSIYMIRTTKVMNIMLRRCRVIVRNVSVPVRLIT